MAELPSTDKVVNTYRKVTVFYSALEKLAAKYESEDKSRAALAAVGLTVRFLQQLNVDRSQLAAFIEAQFIIERSIDGGRKAKKQQTERDVVDCVALELQIRCRVNLKDALKAIVGSDPEAATHLRDFRKSMNAGRKPPARALFDENMKLFRDLPPQEAAKKALRVCANLRGKKV
jgi:hypothetical protein